MHEHDTNITGLRLPPNMHGSPSSDTRKNRSRERVTITLPVALMDRLRNAVYWTSSPPLAQVITRAIHHAVESMERTRGSAFPTRLGPLKRGRQDRLGWSVIGCLETVGSPTVNPTIS